MKLTDADLRERIQARAPGAGSRRASCPSEADLASLVTGEAGEAARGRVVGHILECPDCAEEYRLAGAIEPWARGPAAEGSEQPSQRARTVPRAWAQAIAAAWVLMTIGLGSWAMSLRQENQQLAELRARLAAESGRAGSQQEEIASLRRAAEEAAAPQLNVPIVDLEADQTRAAESAGKLIEVPAGARWVTLVLGSAASDRPSGYAVEIIGPDGRVVWAGEGLRRTGYGTFTLALPSRLVPAGRYRIRIYGGDRQRRRLLEEYAVRIAVK